MSPTLRTPSSAGARRRPHGSFFLAPPVALQPLALVDQRRQPVRHVRRPRSELRRPRSGDLGDVVLALARGFRVSASRRRTPDATALSPTTEMTPMSPVRRTWVPPHSSTDQPMVLRPALAGSSSPIANHPHLVAVFLAEQRAARPMRALRRPPSGGW